MNTCQVCGRECPRKDMEWSHDRYGNPWKLCCRRCLPKAESEIAPWHFDPADAGETLETEDY